MKKLSALVLSMAGYFSFAFPAFAALNGTGRDAAAAAGVLPKNINPCPVDQTGSNITNFNPLCNLSLDGGIIGALITTAFIIATLIALGFLIFGGIKWITSGGDKTGVEGARNTIVASIVGLVIVFLSYFIIRILFGFFNLELNDLKIPSITGTKSKCVAHNQLCRIGGTTPCCKESDSCTPISGEPRDTGKCK